MKNAIINNLIIAGLTLSSHGALIGHWAFDEGTGSIASDSSGQGNDGSIATATWGTDAVRDSYLIFNGLDSIVDPGVTLPVMTDSNDFTWAFWVNSQEDIGPTQQNAVIVGNRFDATGVDFAPRQFIKVTPTKFEWHQNGGGGDNLDVADLEVGTWHHIAVVKTGLNMEYFFDGLLVGNRTLTGVIGSAAHPFFIGGQGNSASANEFFNGYIDDVRIYDEALTAEAIGELIGNANLAPVFSESPLSPGEATAGTAYNATIGDKVADANPGDSITITKIEGPDWLTVGEDGALSGTPFAGDAGLNRFTVQASDGDLDSSESLYIVVVDPAAPPVPDGVFGHWPLNDGSGDVAADVSGHNFDAFITNFEGGGLGVDGSVWAEDPEYGTVLSFNGANGTGAFATVGFPPSFGALPAMTLENDFTWSMWAKMGPGQPVNNDTILGNRYAPDGSDYVPREFIKFTPNQFEFHNDGVPQNTDYDDLIVETWNHHVVVKDGSEISYYRDGVFVSSTVITDAPDNRLPLYFGGFGLENWEGYLREVKLYERALSAAEALELFSGEEEVIRITEFTLNDNRDITLTFTSRNGTNYIVESSNTLAADSWDEIDDSIVGTGNTTTIILPGNVFPNAAATDKLFFRVRKPE